MNKRFVSLAIAAGLTSASCGTTHIAARIGSVSIHTGIASAAEGAISIEADGRTYGVPLDGVKWIDVGGVRHSGGRPDCLAADGPVHPVRFAAVDVTVEGTSWRPVVWVDCR